MRDLVVVNIALLTFSGASCGHSEYVVKQVKLAGL